MWHGRGTHVQVPVADGFLGILPRRQPLLATLSRGAVVVTTPEGGHETFTVDRGFVSLDSDFVTVVADHATVA